MNVDNKRLGDIATYINGYAFKPEQWDTNGKPIIRIQNLNNNLAEFNYYNGDINEKYIVNKGDILISWSASIGVYEWQNEEALLNQHIFKVDFNKININKQYFKYVVGIALERAMQFMHGSTMKHITKKYFDDIIIPIPSLSVQYEVVAVLNKSQQLIDKRKEQIEALDELVKSQFIEMFGDPVKNPLGWELKPFLESGNCKNGMNFSATETGIELQYLGVGDFKDLSKIEDTNNLGKVSLNKMPSSEYLLQDGDIVFVRSNGNKALVGRCLAVYPNGVETTYSGFCIRYRKTDENLEIPYLLQVLKTDSMRKNMAGRGANIQNLNQQILGALMIPVPPLELQKQFTNFIEQVDKLKFEMENSLKELENNFNSLMQRAFKGELFN